MSKEVISQVMQQTCEGCGNAKTWELVGADQNPEILGEMQGWYTVTRKIVVPDEYSRPALQQLTADACCLACVPAAAIKLALPSSQDEPADNIDLNSLRQGIN